MSDGQEDRKVIQCNYVEGTKIAAVGARAYVIWTNKGNGGDRVYILVRSRGARWVKKWETRTRLTNFRVKTIPPEHPIYREDWLADPAWEHWFLTAVGAPGPYPTDPAPLAQPNTGGAR